jgi:hypothetical protein
MLNATMPDQVTDIQALLDSPSTQHTATRRTALKVALGVGYTLQLVTSWRKRR